VEWFHLAEDRGKWRELVNILRACRVILNGRNFFISSDNIQSCSRTLRNETAGLYYYFYYYLLQFSLHSVAVVLILVENKNKYT